MIPDTITTATRAGHVQRVIRYTQDMDHQYLSHGNRRDPVYLPWMPYQAADFLAVMYEVMAEANGRSFLDIGCGVGTKMLLAHEIFGLDVAGVEIDKHMADRAGIQFPGAVRCQDALGYTSYGEQDIIWMYRPFRDPHNQYQLELEVMNSMKSGAILAGGAWQMDTPPDWILLVDDWDNGKRGAYMKP